MRLRPSPGPGNVADSCKYRPISVKQNRKIEAKAVVSECILYVKV